MATTLRKVTLPIVFIAVAAAGTATWVQLRGNAHREKPDAAFAELTGRALPVGVHASAYRSAIDDNFFHAEHYWILEGETDRLRQILVGTGFRRSDEDAKWVAHRAADALGTTIAVEDVLEGYEWEHGRDSWFLILRGGTGAIYVQ